VTENSDHIKKEPEEKYHRRWDKSFAKKRRGWRKRDEEGDEEQTRHEESRRKKGEKAGGMREHQTALQCKNNIEAGFALTQQV